MVVELKLKEAVDQLLGNKPVPAIEKHGNEPVPAIEKLGNKPEKGLDFENVTFTVKLCPTNNKNQEIEWPN